MLKAALISAFLILSAGLATTASAQNNEHSTPMSAQDQAHVDRLMNPFFTTLKSGNVNKAYTDLFKGTLVESKTIEVGQLAAQSDFMLQTSGSIADWQIIRTDCVSPNICLVIYEIRAAEAPLALRLYAYKKPSGEWTPNSVYMSMDPTHLYN